MENNMKIEEWIIEADIRRMQAAMETGETSSEELVRISIWSGLGVMTKS